MTSAVMSAGGAGAPAEGKKLFPLRKRAGMAASSSASNKCRVVTNAPAFSSNCALLLANSIGAPALAIHSSTNASLLTTLSKKVFLRPAVRAFGPLLINTPYKALFGLSVDGCLMNTSKSLNHVAFFNQMW